MKGWLAPGGLRAIQGCLFVEVSYADKRKVGEDVQLKRGQVNNHWSASLLQLDSKVAHFMATRASRPRWTAARGVWVVPLWNIRECAEQLSDQGI